MTRPKILFGSLAKAVVYLVLVAVVLDVALVFGIPRKHLPKNSADAAIVLGAAPGSMALKNRTEKGIEMVKMGKAVQLVLSGGKTSDKDKSEAEYMYGIVEKEDSGMPAVLESNSGNTWENLDFSLNKIGENQTIIIVTDRYHLARSVFTARMVGFEKIYWDSPDSGYYPEEELRRYYLRELTALPWYFVLWISRQRM